MNQPRPVEKLPPHSIEAEEAVLASLMVDDSALDRIDDLVSPEDFFRDQNRWTFEACRALWERHDPINELTVAHELTRNQRLSDAGGVPFIARIVSDLPTPIGVEHYAQIVHTAARYRRAISVGSAIVQHAYEGGTDFDEFLAKCDGLVTGLQDTSGRGAARLDELIDEYFATETIASRSTLFVRTGLMDLDDLLLGLKPGSLTIVAAQTGVGKSVLLLNIAKAALFAQGFRVGVASLEMSRYEWRDRMVANITGIAIDRISVGVSGISDNEAAAVMDVRQQVDKMPLFVDDRGRTSIESIRSTMRRLKPDLILVDYLQLIGGSHKDFRSREQEVAAISRGLKLLAKELDVPVVAAAQLSRQVDQRAKDKNDDTPAQPRLSDLRESGAIEQDADVVLFLYRSEPRAKWPEVYGGKDGAVVRIIVAKARNGRTGHCFARMHDAYARIEDIAPQAEPEPEYQEPMPWAK